MRSLPSTVVFPDIELAEYDAFRALLDHEEDFPATHRQWLERSLQERQQRLAQGRATEYVVVHAKDFADFCLGLGQIPSLALLGAFAVYERTRQA